MSNSMTEKISDTSVNKANTSNAQDDNFTLNLVHNMMMEAEEQQGILDFDTRGILSS
jgi:hypothetical protein